MCMFYLILFGFGDELKNKFISIAGGVVEFLHTFLIGYLFVRA